MIHLVREGGTWASLHSTLHYDVQGDPRWFVEAMGCEAAQVFGFDITSEHDMWVPDVKEFNAAISKVNAELTRQGQAPIPFTFYQGANGKLRLDSYVRKYAVEGQLPIAPGGNHMIHDLSFHSGAILTPPVLNEHLREVSRYVLAVTEALEQHLVQNSVPQEMVNGFRKLMLWNQVELIDFATAFNSLAWIGIRQNNLHPEAAANMAIFLALDLKDANKAPEKILEERARKAFNKIQRQGQSINWPELKKLIHEKTQQLYPQEPVTGRGQIRFHPQVTGEEASSRAFNSFEEFLALWTHRFEEVRAAAVKLRAGQETPAACRFSLEPAKFGP
ncbi:MAG: hypothetical protein AB7F86_20005 [Bdellovibrionales bacterium]